MKQASAHIEWGRARLQSCHQVQRSLRASAPEVRSNRTSRPSFAPLLAVLTLLFIATAGHASTRALSLSALQRADDPSSGASLSQQLAKESREAAGEDDQSQFKHSPSVQLVARLTGLDLEHAYWVCVLLNFVVIGAAIFWLLKKNLPGVFRDRTASIQKAMAEAQKASQDANRRLAEIEARLSRLDVEIGGMRATAEKEVAAEEQRIKAAAEEDRRKIVESAEQEIAAAAKSARRELTAYAADLAVTLAQNQIRVDPATEQALLRDFANQLSVDGNTPKGRQ